MLKIKSNTNEFTIIFSEKIGKKINAEKFSVPALSFFLLQRLFLLFFSSGQRLSFASALFFFSVSGLSFLLQRPSLFSNPHFFLFFWLPFIFQPKILFFSPNVFQFFSPNVFQFFQPKRFCFSSATLLFFFFLLYSFLVQPSFFSFSASFFSFL